MSKQLIPAADEIPAPARGARSFALPGRIIELDGLRGLAILLVLVHHNLLFIQPSQGSWVRPLYNFLLLSWSGVDLFFVLSGFLIGGILFDHVASPCYFKTFYIRRFWRIVPIYGVICLTFWATRSVLLHGSVTTASALFGKAFPWHAYATFTQNFWIALRGDDFGPAWLAVTWSLAIEEQFYLLAPLAIKLIPRARFPWLLGGVILGAPLLRDLCHSLFLPVFPFGPLSAYVLTPCRADCLAMGMLVAWALRTPAALQMLNAHRLWLRIAIGAGLGGLAFFSIQDWRLYSRPMSLFGLSLLALFYTAVLLHVVLFPNGVLGAILRCRLLTLLGTISYGVYLIHFPVGDLFHRLFRSQAPIFQTPADVWTSLGAIAVTLLLAVGSWKWLEKPLIQRGHRHSY